MRALLLVFFGIFLAGCKPNQCEQLMECCQASADLPRVGGACAMSADVRDGEKCQMITETIQAMYEKRDEPIPAACQTQGNP